jgi:hypothetical protein
VKVEIVMPDKPMEPVRIGLNCSMWDVTWRKRIRAEENSIRDELDGWLVLNGGGNYLPRQLGR